jgi:hypothetical protein
VSLEIVDSAGTVINRFNSTDPVPPLDPRYPDPTLWARPPRIVSTAPGHHRYLWDMRYPAVPGMSTGPDASDAVPYNTPAVPSSPWVLPGNYTVRLVAAGQTQSAPLKILIDPRVKTSSADLQQQFRVSKSIYDDMLHATTAIHEITVLRDQMESGKSNVPGSGAAVLEEKLNVIAGRERGGGGGRRGGPTGPPTLGSVRTQLARIEHSIQNADAAPTPAQIEAYEITVKPLASLLEQWDSVKKTDLKALNAQLRDKHLPLLVLDTRIIDHNVEDQIELGDDQ